MRPEDVRAFRCSTLQWTAQLERPLPWRGERDPYRVLVSEVMLQQTQAARIAQAYPSFIARFPTVRSLARAEPSHVLRAWGNLGYNRRALNLWRAARVVVERNGFPRRVTELEGLPGVGSYTARAVASFAFGAEVGVVDANVRRVLSRSFGLPPDADVQALADQLVPRGRSGVWNQAMIDLGADVCRAKTPRCAECPLRGRCAWAAGRRAPAMRSRPKAPPFETTTRYARGRLVAELRAVRDWTTFSSLIGRSGLTIRRAEAALSALERDGIVTRRGNRVYLGRATSRVSAASRRR